MEDTMTKPTQLPISSSQFKLPPRHELFAQGLVQGLTARAAYVQAGYKASDASASHLSRNVKVQARVAEMMAEAGVTIDRIVAELAKIAFSDIRKALDWGMAGGSDGQPVQIITPKDSKDVGDDTSAIISEVRQTNQGIRFKFHDKLQALEKLGRHLGMFKNDAGNTSIEPITVIVKEVE
jgi:phage terminase small subunit